MNNSNNKLKISKEELEDKLSNIIIRQTDYTKKKAIEELQKNNYSLKLVLLEAYNIEKQNSTNKTSNQERFRLMRQILDRR
tara:strand:- start:4812 stop:5054 length:243 start_codon:yes stop_codon:yes gene_type:complete